MKHKTYVNYEGSLEELAVEIANLRYDAFRDFLEFLAAKVYEDSLADYKRNRIKLSNELHEAADHIAQAWHISEPFMKEENGNN